jgi:predicted N-acetyltransferase YhbS
LLGPIAVARGRRNRGVGTALMRHAMDEARRRGHGAVLLVGDAPYYGRFGFSDAKTTALSLPGPYERHRLLGCEFVPGTLEGAHGLIRPTGARMPAAPAADAAAQAAAAVAEAAAAADNRGLTSHAA